jgi:hypothetical protein
LQPNINYAIIHLNIIKKAVDSLGGLSGIVGLGVGVVIVAAVVIGVLIYTKKQK